MVDVFKERDESKRLYEMSTLSESVKEKGRGDDIRFPIPLAKAHASAERLIVNYVSIHSRQR